MKVLIVSNMYPSKQYPSAGIFVKRFCDELKKLNINYDLSVMLKSRNKVEKVYRYAIFYLLTIIFVLFKKYDIVYVHYASHSSIPVILARKLKKFRIITNVHGSDVVPENKKQENFHKYTREILELSEKVVVPSDYFKEYVCDKYLLDKKIVYVYPSGGIDAEVFYPVSTKNLNKLFIKYGLDKNKIYFGYCGRFTAKKGLDTFIRAINIVCQQNSNIEFILVGGGAHEKNLYTLIDELNIRDRIKFFSFMQQNQLKDIYNILTAFVFPTEGESLGLVGIEAMACGTPVIASDCTAQKYYVHNGENGYKFRLNDHEELAKTLLYFIDNNVDIEKLKEGALKTANNYSNVAVLKMLCDIFEN